MPGMSAGESSILRYARMGLLLSCVVYVLAFALAYSVDPLGRSPALDARENLDLAGFIHEGHAGQI